MCGSWLAEIPYRSYFQIVDEETARDAFLGFESFLEQRKVPVWSPTTLLSWIEADEKFGDTHT